MLIKSLFKIYSPLTKLNLKIAKYIKKNNSRTISGLIASLLISSVIISIRQLGSLQFLEILAYDFVVQVANKTYTDPRLLIVEITERDIKNQNRWPISDATFAQLIQQLQEYQPKLIGLDVYREISSPPGTEALQKQFQNDNIITIKYLDHGNQQMSTPANIPESRIGFNDLMLDADNVVRRNLIYAEVGEQKFYSFSLRLSLAYLKDHPLLKNKETQNTPDLQATPEGLYIHNVLIKRLQANSGGYQMPPQEAVGFQTLINYQSPEIAQKVTLTEVLSGKIDPNLVKDKIVLIGTTAPSIKDRFDTPYSSNEKTQAGIVIHAQMVSQILSLVLDN
ncbi:MAG: CHASE2 domain-containing protein, partial [Xenococcaceae cyanobacterium MO_188.B29]|nr:CHASE2 domain-containing protein [Xenococcaceae cyanobacterium MO_188.B29]